MFSRRWRRTAATSATFSASLRGRCRSGASLGAPRRAGRASASLVGHRADVGAGSSGRSRGIDVDVDQLPWAEVERVLGFPGAAVGLGEAGASARIQSAVPARVVDELRAPEAGHAQDRAGRARPPSTPFPHQLSATGADRCCGEARAARPRRRPGSCRRPRRSAATWPPAASSRSSRRWLRPGDGLAASAEWCFRPLEQRRCRSSSRRCPSAPRSARGRGGRFGKDWKAFSRDLRERSGRVDAPARACRRAGRSPAAEASACRLTSWCGCLP